jgi:protein associated with RNAse G/E
LILEHLQQCLICDLENKKWMKKIKTCQFSTKWFWHNIVAQFVEDGIRHNNSQHLLEKNAINMM